MERISVHQFLMLSAGVTLGGTFFPVGTTMAATAGRDGWIAVIPAFLFGAPFGFMILTLAERYPQKNLFEISEQILGKWMGKTLGIIVSLIVVYFGGLLFGQSIDMFSRSILSETPRWIFILSELPLFFMMVYAGIEVLARFSEIVFPIVAAALVGTALLSIPRFEPGELFPFLENGVKPLLYGVIQGIPWPMEYILFLGGLIKFLPRDSKKMKQIRVKIWPVFLAAGLLDMIITLAEIWVFGSSETTRLTYGLLTLGKMIEISRTVSGIESIFTLFWLGAHIIKISALYFLALWGAQSLFGFKRWVTHGLIILIMIIVAWTSLRGVDLLNDVAFADSYLILPLALVWVVLLWGVSTWKQRIKNQSLNEG